MLRLNPVALLLLVTCGACGAYSNPEPEVRPRPEDLESFASQLEDDLQMHNWQEILVDSDPTFYQEQVVELGISEPEYVALLLGFQKEDVQIGDEFNWDDLERITSVRLDPVGSGSTPAQLTGTAGLEGGATIRLDAWVTRIRGRFVLTKEVT